MRRSFARTRGMGLTKPREPDHDASGESGGPESRGSSFWDSPRAGSGAEAALEGGLWRESDSTGPSTERGASPSRISTRARPDRIRLRAFPACTHPQAPPSPRGARAMAADPAIPLSMGQVDSRKREEFLERSLTKERERSSS
jgi:hypothetical protein